MPRPKKKYGFYHPNSKRTFWYLTPSGERVEISHIETTKRSCVTGSNCVGEVLTFIGLAKRPPLSYLKEIVGEAAYRALRENRAYLHIWRCSSPHNWYIETIKRKKLLWHSDTERLGSPKPHIRDFELIEDSEKRVFHPWNRQISEMPEKSTYRLITE